MSAADNNNQIGFEQAGLGSVLKQNLLNVPANQREYAWEERQVNQLFNDFARSISEGENAYFLGTIVTIPRQNGTLEVVDGQQRLATTALLLAAMRDYLITRDPMLVEAINNEFLTGIDRERRARIPRLRLNVDDNELFSWMISKNEGERQPAATRDSHLRLIEAFKLAKNYVESIVKPLDAKDHGDFLNRWVSFIELGAVAILLRVPNDANAYKMFETLNDRGLRVSQADLIKNYLFGKSGGRIHELQNKWTYMRGALESIDEDDTTVSFLRYAMIAMSGPIREVEVYDRVQAMVKGEPQAVSFVSQLEELSEKYVALFNSSHELWNGFPVSIRRAVDVLILLNVRPMRALVLAITYRMAPANALQSFSLLISLAVRLLVASSTRSGTIENRLSTAASLVYDRTLTSASELAVALRDITPNDLVFEEAFANVSVSNSRMARYYLRSLEETAQGSDQPWFIPNDNQSIINLEHVLPRNQDVNWPAFTPDNAFQYSRRLGNMVLMNADDNNALGNAGFVDKKAQFANAPYQLTSEVAAYPDWSPTEIEHRQKGLAGLAVKAWPLFIP